MLMRQKVLSILALLLMAVTGNAAEKSETISLIGEKYSENETATGTHFKVTCGYLGIDDGGLTINKFGAMTVSALDGTVMTKVTWSYRSLSQNAGTLSATPGTYNGSNTVTGINSTTLTVTSSHAAGVKLSSITIYYEVEDVAVTGITLDKTSAEMTVGGDALTLTPTVLPDDATNKTVTWTTSDASVATVTDGVVTAVAAGTATITATATNGTDDTSDDFSATCEVTVTDPATKYNLSLADGSNTYGTVAFTVGGNAVTQAKKDDLVTVSVTPTEGYSAKDVTVRACTSWEDASDVLTGGGDNPGLVSDINVTKQENGTWTFTMPEANVWVVVTYTKNLQDAWIQTIADQTYTGSAIEPTIEVKDGETTLVANTDYTVAYSDNTNAGTATVTIAAVEGSDYSGTASKTFNIVKADITMTTTPAAVSGLVYSGEGQTLITAGVASFGTVLYSTDGETYAEALPQGTAAGTYTVYYKVEGDANHNAFAAQTVSVTIATNKTVLNTAITEAETYYNSISETNPDAAATLLDAINTARGVQGNADATQTEIETAAQTLNDAVTAAQADVALKRITLTIPAKSYMARIDADKRQIEVAVSGVSLYTVKNVTNTEVELTAELSVIAAEMPYFIYNDNDTEVEVSIIVSSEEADNVDYDSDHFKGTLVDKTFTDEDMEECDHYVLSGGSSFVWVKDAGVLSAGKCWIELIPTSAAHARRLSIVHEGGTTTGINAISSAAQREDEWYDLSGRRVAQPTKGLFIVNGKKVVVK